MKKPEKDSIGNSIKCDECSLHLIGFVDSEINSIHSEEHNKGVIMAQGNIGRYLDLEEVNTFISDDGVYYFKLGTQLERDN